MSAPANEHAARDKPALSRKRLWRETPDVVAGLCRQLRAVGRRIAQEDTDGLLELQRLQVALDEVWATAIAGLRATGYSDADIGRELGVTRQAVAQRWPRGE